jgi:hypothetical protein
MLYRLHSYIRQLCAVLYSGDPRISPGRDICPGWPSVSRFIADAQRTLHGFSWLHRYGVCDYVFAGIQARTQNGEASRSHLLVRTRHILEVAGDKEYRKRILQGLNKGESRNALAKDLRYARQAVIQEKDPDMRLCVASSINLMILCIAIWNTIYMQRGIRSLREEGYQISQEDLGFLSPFGHAHINLYGQFFFQPFSGLDSLAARKEFEPLL